MECRREARGSEVHVPRRAQRKARPSGAGAKPANAIPFSERGSAPALPPSRRGFYLCQYCRKSTGRGWKAASRRCTRPLLAHPRKARLAAPIASRIAGPAIGHFERNGRKKFGEPRKIGLLQNGPAHWRPKPWGQHLGARAQPGETPSRPKRPLLASWRLEKSYSFSGAFFGASGKQFRSLADRWRSSATGHAGPLSWDPSAAG